MSGITQSLAGRVALLNLLPFSASELRHANMLPPSLDEALFKGSYPPIYDRHLEPGIWYANYVQTYIERDVRQLIIIHRLPPHHQNFNKRLVKTPKLYFHDTGLAAWLLGIESAAQVASHPLRGALFETWVVADYLKKRLNTARPSNLSFWRDRSGHEVDLLVEQGGNWKP